MKFVTTAIQGLITLEKSGVPRLPVVPFWDVKGMTMKTPYFKKLLDPRWQKKRLQVLEAAEWTCEACGDATSTLHVHHKQYFKGREPWEYEAAQLGVLCEECHANAHEDVDPLLWVASFAPISGPIDRSDASWLLAGATGVPVDSMPSYPYAKALHVLGAAASHAAFTYWNRVGMQNISEQDPAVIAEVAMEAVFKHFGQSLERKQGFR